MQYSLKGTYKQIQTIGNRNTEKIWIVLKIEIQRGSWQPTWVMTIRAVCWPVATQTSSGRETRSCERKPAKNASPAPVVSLISSGWSFTAANSQESDDVAQTTPEAPQVTTTNRSFSLDQSQSADPILKNDITSIIFQKMSRRRSEKKQTKKQLNLENQREDKIGLDSQVKYIPSRQFCEPRWLWARCD